MHLCEVGYDDLSHSFVFYTCCGLNFFYLLKEMFIVCHCFMLYV